MNMICCGQVIDTIRRMNNQYELMVEWNGPPGHSPISEDLKIEEFYLPISFCPFCGIDLSRATERYNERLNEELHRSKDH